MHDILPPKLAHKVEDTIKSLEVGNKKGRRQKKVNNPSDPKGTTPRASKKSRFPLKGFLVGIGLLGLALCVYGYIKLPKADIEIWPKMDTLTLSQKVTADTSVTAEDSLNNMIPAKYIEVRQDGLQEFPATGIASNDGKAGGTIKVYNKLDSAFTLIKGTHFLSDSGKYFVTVAKIIIPGAQTKSGKLVAGSIDVGVQAQDIGVDYNIGPSKFSIPKLNGTSYYYSIYGESTNAMSGGYTGNVKKVTNDDILQARDVLTKKTMQDGKDALKSKLMSDEVLLDGAIESSVIDATCDVAPDTIKDSFNETVKVKASALVFKKQDLEKLIQDKLTGQLSADKDFLQSSLSLNYNPSLLDIKKGKLALDVQGSVKTYQNITSDDFIDLLVHKSADQVQSTVNQMYNGGITDIKVNFWPFWVTRTPSDKNRITIHLNFQ